MQKAIVRRTFDVVRNQRQEPIYAAKGDYGARYIQAIITADGVPYAIPENAVVTINAFRRDGKTNRFKGEVNADGSVIVPITQWMLEILGMVDCTISAVEEGGMLTTENFYVVANESSTNVEVSTDDPQYDLLTEVLLNEGTRQKQFSDMVEYINSLEQGKQGPVGPVGMHIGPEAPTDGQVAWIDTNEEPSAEEGGANFDIVAKPGQVIAVKAVDVEGKPKEYKAVDLPVHDAPDWNAAEGEAGSVKNRTHYVDEKGVVHKLPNKFIDADWMATSEEGGGDDVVISEQKLTSGMWDNLQMAIQPGFEYDVYINGVLYPCVAHADDEGIYLGNNISLTMNDIPFCIMWAGGNAKGGFYFRDSNVLSDPLYLKVTDHAYVKYNKLPEEFLPDGVVKSVNGAKPDEKGNVQIEIPENTGGGIPYIVGNSTTAGKWTGECAEITEYYEGLTVLYKLNVAGASGGTTLDINGLGAVEVNRNASTAVTTIYPAGSVLMLTYSDGKWLTADYDVNTKNTTGTSHKAATKMYLVGATSQNSNGVTTYTNSAVYIGTDNALYSNGKKVARNEDIPDVSGMVKSVNGAKPDANGNVSISTGGGGGGGSIDVTAEVGQTIIVKEVDENGKPTKWESADYQPRTHWAEMAELQPSTTITPYYYEELGIPMGGLSIFDIVVGNKYTVTFDGVEYECEAFIASMEGMSAPAFGNAAVAGGEDTGEPFAIFKMAGDNIVANIIFFDMNPHTVRVEGEVAVPIPAQYVSNALPYYINVEAETFSDVQTSTKYTCTDTVANVEAAFASGKDVRVKLTVTGSNSSEGFLIYHLIMRVNKNSVMVFACMINGLGGPSISDKLMLIPRSDGTYIISSMSDV